jgi:hypothetical protein
LRAQFGYEVCAAKVGGNSKSYGHPQLRPLAMKAETKATQKAKLLLIAPSQNEVSASAKGYQN